MERRAIDVVRALAMDAPHAANSGHQGTAMALAPLAHVLFTRVMRYDSDHPDWPDRDRFVLSCGHASILQYAMLHLCGFGVGLDDLRDFRQWGSLTPGHPEVHHTPGVEVTTGPLGQGFANAVGMAIAERSLQARFGPEACHHHIWGICSDGDLSEGVSHEAASLAGHLGLGNLCMVYDDNHISIDGPTELTLSDDAATRFRAYGWHVIELGESGEDLSALEGALRAAREVTDRPSLVVVRTHIAFPSDAHTDDPAAHGLCFSADEIAATKTKMGLPPDEAFYVPDDVLAFYREAGGRGRDARETWEKALTEVLGDRADEWEASLASAPLPGFEDAVPRWEPGEKVATRVALAATLTAVLDTVPGLVSGGADLTGNTGTMLKGATPLSAAEPAGRLIHFGIREHAMGAVMNGMALHGGLLPVGGTFLVFSDYMRPAVRLAALMGTKVIFAWSHDSVGVGEDGPTHQPVEHVAALRAIPGLPVVRPADANECATAARIAIEGTGPVALIMSRQNLPVLDGTTAEGVARGAYVLVEREDADVTLVATGSEVAVALDAVGELESRGVVARVVSMPCWEWFEQTPETYQAEVLPDIPTLAVEAQVNLGWHRWADDVVSIDRFGASAPGDVVMRELGITATNVADRAAALVDVEGAD
ncbi:MAG TPA: transketolase [Microthrixaceae bacterium]|nr:transketolase [Microthrixaceae bacterium]